MKSCKSPRLLNTHSEACHTVSLLVGNGFQNRSQLRVLLYFSIGLHGYSTEEEVHVNQHQRVLRFPTRERTDAEEEFGDEQVCITVCHMGRKVPIPTNHSWSCAPAGKKDTDCFYLKGHLSK